MRDADIMLAMRRVRARAARCCAQDARRVFIFDSKSAMLIDMLMPRFFSFRCRRLLSFDAF